MDLRTYGPQIRYDLGYLICNRTITGVLIDFIVFHIWSFYCFILIVLCSFALTLLLSSPPYCSGFRLLLLFSLRHSHAIVLCGTIAPSCISRVDCMLWSHSSFSFTVAPACPLHFCAYHPLCSSLTLLAQPCDLPWCEYICCSSGRPLGVFL